MHGSLRHAAQPAGTEGPLPLYRAKLAAGEIAPDPAQALVAERLQNLWWRLRDYDPPSSAAHGVFSRLWPRHGAEHAPTQNGLYIAGEVGRGKSMLMDLFFSTVALPRKRRVHFDPFMQDVRQTLHLHEGGPGDPIPPLAEGIRRQSLLLCFDEFQINDIADALLLGRLFSALFARGVIMVVTSNTVPDDLFKDRPGRDAFLPFIAILKQHLELLVIEGARDFRRERLQRLPVWHVPADGDARAALDRDFLALAGKRGEPSTLAVMGRSLAIPCAAGDVARFTFQDLCERPLGAPDYLALATHFHVLVLDDIPRLATEQSDWARRFTTLIDALYEHRVKLIASAAAEPDQLYPEGDAALAFRRTSSRLIEMRTRAYLEAPHLT